MQVRKVRQGRGSEGKYRFPGDLGKDFLRWLDIGGHCRQHRAPELKTTFTFPGLQWTSSVPSPFILVNNQLNPRLTHPAVDRVTLKATFEHGSCVEWEHGHLTQHTNYQMALVSVKDTATKLNRHDAHRSWLKQGFHTPWVIIKAGFPKPRSLFSFSVQNLIRVGTIKEEKVLSNILW